MTRGKSNTEEATPTEAEAREANPDAEGETEGEERISIETAGDTFRLIGSRSGLIEEGIATRQEAISKKAALLGRDDPYNPTGDEVPASFAEHSTLETGDEPKENDGDSA